MSTRVELADLQNEADQEYGNYEIGLGEERPPLVLVPVLRLDEQKIQRFYELHQHLAKLGADQKNKVGGDGTITALRQAFHEMLTLAAQDPDIAKQFLADHGGDFVLLQKVFTGYMQSTQPGEASASPS